MSSLSASFNGVEVEYQQAQYARLKSTYDLHRMSRPTYNEWQKGIGVQSFVTGLPDVYRLLERDPNAHPEGIELDSDKQHWLLKIQYDVLRGKAHTKTEYMAWFSPRSPEVLWMIKQLESCLTNYRSHTNKHGLDNRANYLSGTNLNEGLPKWGKLGTGWMCVKATGRIRPITSHGECVEFECINASEDYWQYSPITHKHLFDKPLTTARIINNGKIVRDDLHIPYGQFNNRLEFPIWMPTVSTAWIPVSQVAFGGWRDKVWIR